MSIHHSRHEWAVHWVRDQEPLRQWNVCTDIGKYVHTMHVHASRHMRMYMAICLPRMYVRNQCHPQWLEFGPDSRALYVW